MDCWMNEHNIYHDLIRAQGVPIEINKPLEYNQKLSVENEEVEGESSQQHLQTAESTTMQPDLLGITKMLRMVDTEQNPGNKLDYSTTKVVVISKLNPNVAEFIPKKTLSTSTVNSDQPVIKTDSNCDISNNVGLNKLNDDEKKKMQKELLSKIGTTQTTTEKSRLERNSAIAGILKLCTQQTSNLKPMKPDEFFKNEDTDVTDTPSKEVIKKSVDRVDMWLNGATEMPKRKKSLYLGPITFKKKSKLTESNTTINTVSSWEMKVNNFSPTNIANDLTKKYSKRIMQRENASMDIWSKLQRDLRAKDEEIKKKSSNNSL